MNLLILSNIWQFLEATCQILKTTPIHRMSEEEIILCFLHWQVDSLPLSHLGSLSDFLLIFSL